MSNHFVFQLQYANGSKRYLTVVIHPERQYQIRCSEEYPKGDESHFHIVKKRNYYLFQHVITGKYLGCGTNSFELVSSSMALRSRTHVNCYHISYLKGVNVHLLEENDIQQLNIVTSAHHDHSHDDSHSSSSSSSSSNSHSSHHRQQTYQCADSDDEIELDVNLGGSLLSASVPTVVGRYEEPIRNKIIPPPHQKQNFRFLNEVSKEECEKKNAVWIEETNSEGETVGRCQECRAGKEYPDRTSSPPRCQECPSGSKCGDKGGYCNGETVPPEEPCVYNETTQKYSQKCESGKCGGQCHGKCKGSAFGWKCVEKDGEHKCKLQWWVLLLWILGFILIIFVLGFLLMKIFGKSKKVPTMSAPLSSSQGSVGSFEAFESFSSSPGNI